MRLPVLSLALLVCACPSIAPAGDAGTGEGTGEGEGEPEGEGEGEGEGKGEGEGGGEGEGEGEALPPCRVDDVSAPPLSPVAGEVFWQQIGLGGFSIGEAALLVLPDGSRVLVDVGNGSHDDDILDVLDAHFGADDRRVDAVVLTHHHADHEGGLTALMENVEVSRVFHRGFVDVTPAANEDLVVELCEALDGTARDAALCARAGAGCAPATLAAAPTSCPLPRAVADGLSVIGVDGFIGDGSFADDVGPFRRDDSNGENGRSVIGVVRHGGFRLLFAGDLTGGGSDTDDVEGFVVDHLDDDLRRGVDVLHLSHHARDTSSSLAWLDALLPDDGAPRAALAGIATAHVNSPHGAVNDAVLDGRLSGGALWLTTIAAGGEGGGQADVVDASGGSIRVVSEGGGDAHVVQAVDGDGLVVRSQRLSSARRCRR